MVKIGTVDFLGLLSDHVRATLHGAAVNASAYDLGGKKDALQRAIEELDELQAALDDGWVLAKLGKSRLARPAEDEAVGIPKIEPPEIHVGPVITDISTCPRCESTDGMWCTCAERDEEDHLRTETSCFDAFSAQKEREAVGMPGIALSFKEDDDRFVTVRLTRQDARKLYDHTGTMPFAEGSWSNNVRDALSGEIGYGVCMKDGCYQPITSGGYLLCEEHAQMNDNF